MGFLFCPIGHSPVLSSNEFTTQSRYVIFGDCAGDASGAGTAAEVDCRGVDGDSGGVCGGKLAIGGFFGGVDLVDVDLVGRLRLFVLLFGVAGAL